MNHVLSCRNLPLDPPPDAAWLQIEQAGPANLSRRPIDAGYRGTGVPERGPLRSLLHPPAANPLGSRWRGGLAASITSPSSVLCLQRFPCARGGGGGERCVPLPKGTRGP
jgi:hypothetical protein